MSSAFPPLSASVTRILSLTGFSPQIKTRDIQAAFGDWENVNGGFKIKWVDDTSLFIVFADAGVAKRAYLQSLSAPPPIFSSPTSGTVATIRPYDGPDAQSVILAVNSRGGNNHRTRASISAPSGAGAQGTPSHLRVNSGNSLKVNGGTGYLSQSNSTNSNLSNLGREPSPTLPNIPNQPTLNSLISSTLSEISPTDHPSPELEQDEVKIISGTPGLSGSASAPKIGDPGRRMVGAALGIRHPGLGHRSVSSGGSTGVSADQALKEVQKALATVSVSD